jgi:polyphosphate kinase 2 (PPK2 family)
VEKVMGFCTKKQYESFFTEVKLFEKMLVESNLIILKYYLDIGKEEQWKRLKAREDDPLKQWKISPIDQKALKHWKDYSEARDEMLLRTNFKHAPWFVVNAEDKKTAHIALIKHLLSRMKYPGKEEKLLGDFDDLVYPATPENIKDRLFR